MKNRIVLLSFFAVSIVMSACSTHAVRPNRHGLLNDNNGAANTDQNTPGNAASADASASSAPQTPNSSKVDRKTAAEMYALKPGGNLDLKGDWQWPLNHVEISSTYGERGGKFHQGIDLRAPMKTPVYAASDGVVVYVGSKIRGYGRMIVLKHAGNYYTVYAHHSKNVAKMGAKVQRGQLIAYTGISGHSTGPHLHFELRRGTQSYDPEYAFNGYFKVSANRKIASQSSLSHDFEE